MFIRNKLSKGTLEITNTRPEHIEALQVLSFDDWEDTNECFNADHFLTHMRRFPEGQFVALMDGKPIGYAVTMRVQRTPYQTALPWINAIGDMTLSKHHPRGEWLYGVDFLVDANFRRQGIGSRMYKARFELVKRLNMRGFYAGGMLAGYYKHHKQMSVREYADKVRNGEIKDPTVSMQLNRGFTPQGVIEKYCSEPPPYNSAMLIVWDNPQYRLKAAGA